jgi:hypothetical protein
VKRFEFLITINNDTPGKRFHMIITSHWLLSMKTTRCFRKH